MDTQHKIVVIGIDGGTYDLMNDWMTTGKLPNFNRIRKNGTYGKLVSTIPPYSAPAWTSITTGCYPGKHGIYDFFKTSSVSKRIISSRCRKVPAIWNYLSEHDKKNIIVAVPGTYPPEKISGKMISGLLTPSNKSIYTYPSSLKEQLTDHEYGEYLLEKIVVDEIPKYLYSRYKPETLVEKINQTLVSHATVTVNLMNKSDWDFSMVVFRGTDDVQHLLWNNKQYVLSSYKIIDSYIGQMIEQFSDTTFIVVSDHGFLAPKKFLYVNNVLYNEGYLTTHSIPNHNIENFLFYIFERYGKILFYFLLMEKFIKTSIFNKFIMGGSWKKNIDFLHSKALYHSVCSHGIRILINEKYRSKPVGEKEYNQLRDELIQIFLDLLDPDTDKPIVKNVYRWEDLYGKTAVNDPLDLILDLEPEYGTRETIVCKTNKDITSLNPHNNRLPIVIKPGITDWVGDHSSEGIVFLYGRNIKKNCQITASVVDIAPTIMSLFNLSIPEIMDGTVLNEALIRKPDIVRFNSNKINSNSVYLTIQEMQKIMDNCKIFRYLSDKNGIQI